MSEKPLNQRQEAFVRHYTAGADGVRGNATKAAIAAGYSERGGGAEVTGHRLLRNPKVATVIEHLRAAALEAASIKLCDWNEMVPEARETLERVMRCQIPAKLAEPARKAANDILDRALGKVPTRVQHSGELTIDALLSATDDDDRTATG